uniref:immunoglobulin superfamily member 6 n=1 Tax=Semicossyphus pulcher TaxID=241346 RepID=UPI0037E8A14C
MDGSFWFSVMLFSLSVKGSIGKDESCLSQPNELVWQKTGQNVVLPCNISSHCATTEMHYEWFTFKENSHLCLNVSSNPQKYSLEGPSLRIKSLHTNDSGIYHCAAVSQGEPAQGKQHVALGTTLVVRENVELMTGLLWSSFALLAIYSLAVVTLIIKKYNCSVDGCRRMRKTYKNNSTKTRRFRDVLQEINSRNNLERSKQAVNRNLSHTEAASTDFNSPADDIYQNV